MISGAKAYKVQLGGDSPMGDWNVRKVLQRADANIPTFISRLNMWNNMTILKDDMSKNSIAGRFFLKLTVFILFILIQLI